MNYAQKISNDVTELLNEVKSLKAELAELKAALNPNAEFESELNQDVDPRHELTSNDKSAFKWIERNIKAMKFILDSKKEKRPLATIALDLNSAGFKTLTGVNVSTSLVSNVINSLLRYKFIDENYNTTKAFNDYFGALDE